MKQRKQATQQKYYALTFWSVKEYMLPMIWAAILRVSVDRLRNARCTTGIMRARDGASMKWTNLVSRRRCRQLVVFFVGSCSAASSIGTIAASIM